MTVVENTVSVPPVVISVQSANLFGAIKMTGVASNLYVAVPFEGFAGGAREAQDLIHAANLEPGTKMYVWNKGEDKYDVYEVSSEHKWIAPISITVKEDKDGKEAYAAETADLTRGVAPGAGVILARKDTAQAVHVYGQVPATVAPPPPFSAGQTLVSVPSTNAMAAVDLNAFAWSGVAETRSNRLKGKASADYIQFRAADGSLVQYYYEGASKWGLPSAQAKKHPELVPDGKALVPAGTAFWYYRNPAASGDASVAW